MVLSVVITALVGFLYFYLTLPALNPVQPVGQTLNVGLKDVHLLADAHHLIIGLLLYERVASASRRRGLGEGRTGRQSHNHESCSLVHVLHSFLFIHCQPTRNQSQRSPTTPAATRKRVRFTLASS